MTNMTRYTGTTITTPGRFEGEPDYIERYYNLMLDGASDAVLDYGSITYDAFHLTADDPAVRCDDAAVGDVLLLWTTDQGFVCCDILTAAEYDALGEQD